LLWIGLADCLGTPTAGATAGTWQGGVPWSLYANTTSTNGWDGAGATCVGWGTKVQVERWCRDWSVRGIDAW
jgi:hypothetical protein